MNRLAAHFFSVVGHPMLVLTYVLILMMSISPYAFGAADLTEKRAMLILLGVFITTALLPAVGLLMMKALGFVKTWQIYDKQERIGPYIMSGVFYLWLFKNLLSGGQTPVIYTAFVLGATLSLFLCFFLNIFTKISAHAAGMGGMVMMLVLLPFYWHEAGAEVTTGPLLLSWPVVISLGLLMAGAVGSARLTLGAHTPADLYRGYLVGAVAVFIATSLLC